MFLRSCNFKGDSYGFQISVSRANNFKVCKISYPRKPYSMSLPYSYAECSLFIYAVVMDEAQGNREGVSPCKIDF